MTTHAPIRLSPIRMGPILSGAYSCQSWRIHEITHDFQAFVEAMRCPELVEGMSSDDRDFPAAYRLLFAVRWALGRMLGADEEESAPDGYSAQMSVLVRPNGLLGNAYMMLIKPFRYLVVYPALLRTVGRRWETAQGAARCDVSSLSR